ncbi:hypothetical protein HDV05_001359 [Chytridiales sp. JEL 0842]|nr:hypothetical protein HDV05_001359 [Chytridiales sp. JEL 0842]
MEQIGTVITVLEQRFWKTGLRNVQSNILIHSKDPEMRELTTTQRSSFDATTHYDPNKGKMGKRRALVEAEMMKQALDEMKEAPTDKTAKNWVSTAHNDYIPFSAKKIEDLGKGDEAQKFSHPITFWTDQALKGTSTVICSSTPAEVHHTAAELGGVRFGRHAAFSTPIKEYTKGSVKDV